MKDLAYIKKYKVVLNFIYELIFNLIFSSFIFFISLLLFKLKHYSSLNFNISLITGIVTFVILFAIAVIEMVYKIKFNKNNSNKTAIKINNTSKTIVLTNINLKIEISQISKIKYIQTSCKEFFMGYYYLFFKSDPKKSNMGNLTIYLKNGNKIVINRVIDIKNVYNLLNKLIEN